MLLLILFYTSSGVTDIYRKIKGIFAGVFSTDRQGYRPCVGIFDRVVGQIYEDLSDAEFVGEQAVRCFILASANCR